MFSLQTPFWRSGKSGETDEEQEHLEEYEQILKFHNQMLEICSRLEEHFQYEERLKGRL